MFSAFRAVPRAECVFGAGWCLVHEPVRMGSQEDFRMFKSGLKTSGSLLAIAVLSVAGSASAQFTQNDGAVCGAVTPDANGGCNVTGSPFQDLGSFAVGAVFNVTGTIGSFDPANPASGTNKTSRDLDWYKITLTSDSEVRVTLNRDDGGTVVLFVGNPATCPAAPFFGQELPSFSEQVFFLEAGEYYIIATTPFEPTPTGPYVHSCSPYSLDVIVNPGDSACAASTDSCVTVHAAPGCDDWSCCNAVCAVDPTCCSSGWDASCVNDGAVGICGFFIFNCPSGGPVNDCLTSPQIATVGSTVNFNTATANTDGPGTIVTGAASLMGKDVWYVVQAPANGQLTISGCAGTAFDQVIEIYGLGTNPVPDPDLIASQFIGQVDDTCGTVAGPATLTLIDAVGGEYYLIRVGGFDDDGIPGTQNDVANGPGAIEISFDGVVYTTGAQKFVNDATGAGVNLGLSSGSLSAAQPRRWLARPFNVPTPSSGGNAWEVTSLIAKGFTAVGATNTNLHYIIWERTGFLKPNDGDQIVSGSVPFPAPFDDGLDAAANASHQIDLEPPVVLEPGDYYITFYASNPTDFAAGGTTPANFPWFIYAPGAIVIKDPAQNGGNVFTWRSANFPTPGFIIATVAGFTVQSGDNPDWLLNNAFTVLGNPTTVASACVGDLNNDGNVGAADLGILLGAWGGPGGDLNNDGATGAADLGILLGAWGACP
jgi:hypothetical protein